MSVADVVRRAVAELDGEHRQDPTVTTPGGGCVVCWPKDGTWPCLTRMVADDLRAAVDAPCPTCENTGLHPAGDPDGLGCWDCARSPAQNLAHKPSVPGIP